MMERQDFADRDGLAAALADAVAQNLRAGIASRGKASLAVSGGSTPAMFFASLGANDNLDWSKITVTLVDERWVDESSDRSNARLVKQNLLQGAASKAVFIPLYAGGEPPASGIVEAVDDLQKDVPHPFDAVVLGMGNDGHTASFFPGGDVLDLALSAKDPAIAIRAAGAGEPRITLTLPHLLATNNLYLHIEGSEKAATLETALGDGPVNDMPVRAVLRQDQVPVKIYWCP